MILNFPIWQIGAVCIVVSSASALVCHIVGGLGDSAAEKPLPGRSLAHCVGSGNHDWQRRAVVAVSDNSAADSAVLSQRPARVMYSAVRGNPFCDWMKITLGQTRQDGTSAKAGSPRAVGARAFYFSWRKNLSVTVGNRLFRELSNHGQKCITQRMIL
jgi:hypothetical protein